MGEAGLRPVRLAAATPAVTPWLRRLVLVVAATTVPLGIAAEWAFANAGATPLMLAYDLAVGWAFAAAGLVISRRQPASRSGLLMTVEGLTWFLTNFQGSGVHALVLVATLLAAVNEAVLAHLVLTFPSGRTSSRAELVLLLALYGAALVGGAAYIDTAGPAVNPYRCQGCTAGVMLLTDNQALVRAAERGAEGLGAVAGLVLVTVVCSRWIGSTVAERRLRSPLWLSMGACALITGSHVLSVLQIDLDSGASQAYFWLSDVFQLVVPFAFLIVALRLRMTRAAVGELVLAHGSDLTLDGFRAALARALGDPSIEVGLWDVASEEFRDAAGRRMELPAPDDRRLATRIDGPEGPLGLVVHDLVLADDPRLVQAIASALRLVAERARDAERLLDQLEEVRASRARIAEAGDAARRQLERDLHDGAQQRLVTLSMTLASTLRQLRELPETSTLRATLEQAADQLRLSLAELRELARGIHPAILSERGLAGAIESVAARMPLPVDVAVEAGRLPAPVEMAAYTVLCEALTNVARHSGASRASVSGAVRGGRLELEVVDDGIGGAAPERGSGLRGMADRVEACGGTFHVESPPGGGTRLRAEIPCA